MKQDFLLTKQVKDAKKGRIILSCILILMCFSFKISVLLNMIFYSEYEFILLPISQQKNKNTKKTFDK